HIVALMTIYTSVLGLSGALGPLSALLFEWRGALFAWAILAAAQVVVWLIVAARTGFDFPSGGRTRIPHDNIAEAAPGPAASTPAEAASAPDAEATSAAGAAPADWLRASLWKAPTAICLMLFFGLQSTNAYIQMGWLPQIYRDAGLDASVGSIGLSLVGALNVIGGLVMPTLIDRVRN